MYFDSHAHLDDARFKTDFDEILARMKENGVTAMMNIGCDLPSSENSVRLAESFPWIWAAVGSHPDDADHVDASRISVYRELCKHPRVKAIGEIGLDYHYDHSDRDRQQASFRAHIAAAREGRGTGVSRRAFPAASRRGRAHPEGKVPETREISCRKGIGNHEKNHFRAACAGHDPGAQRQRIGGRRDWHNHY